MPKKFLSVLSLGLLVCLSLGFFSDQTTKVRLLLATATTGGTYYPVGVAIATLTTTQLEGTDGISMTAITSAGSAENIQLLKNREADLANIRKKNFSIDRRGSGTEVSGREILKSLGFSPEKDLRLSFLGYAPSAAALQNGRIVGMNIPAGPPASAITQAYASIGAKNLRILEFTDSQLEAVNSEYPVWKRHPLPPGTYPGQDVSVQTIAQPNLLVVHRDLAEDVIYKILKTMYENLDYLQKIHQATKAMFLVGAIEGLSLPLHAGAVRFYREKGLPIPARLLEK